MALSVGDAVLTFLGDTTQLDQAFNKVATEAGAKMGVATTAIQGTATAVDEMTKSMAVGQNGAVELGTVTNLAGEQVKESMYEARGEAGLLGEMFGIHLPRHVRSFISELPVVGVALSAAFQATAVLFLIDALAQGIEKITVWAEHGEKIKQAWEQYDQTIFESSTHMQQEIDKTDQKLIEMTQGPLAGLGFALNHIRTTAFETFSLITKDVEAAVKAMNEASSSLIGIQFNVFKDSGKDLEKFRLELEKVMREAALAAPKDPFASYEAGIELVKEKERELTALIKQRTAASGLDSSAAVGGLHAERQAVNDMLPLLQQGVRLQKDKDDIAKKSFAKEAIKEEVRLTELLDKAHKELNKELEKGADDVSKHLTLQLTNQLKAEEKAGMDKLRLSHQQEEGAIAAIDGEMKAREIATERASQLLRFQYDRGQLTQQQYVTRVTQLYNQEVQALIQMLNRKEQLVILEAQNEAAQRGRIMTVEEAKELKGFIDLENQKRQVIDKSLKTIESDIDRSTTHAKKAKPTWDKFFDDIISGSLRSGNALKTLGAITAQAIGDSVAAAVSGSQSFGAAMEQMLKSALAMLAGKAVVKVLEELAEAASALANPFTAALAPAHFHAAAMWGIVAGAAGAAGAALPGGGGGSGSGGTGNHPQIDSNNPNNQPGAPPQSGHNVPHLAGGGLITAPTLAMIGEGGSREAVIPLNDSSALNSIADAISRHLESGGGGNNFYLQPKGMVSSDTLSKLVKKISRQVQTGRARLVASNSHKLTRRA